MGRRRKGQGGGEEEEGRGRGVVVVERGEHPHPCQHCNPSFPFAVRIESLGGQVTLKPQESWNTQSEKNFWFRIPCLFPSSRCFTPSFALSFVHSLFRFFARLFAGSCAERYTHRDRQTHKHRQTDTLTNTARNKDKHRQTSGHNGST